MINLMRMYWTWTHELAASTPVATAQPAPAVPYVRKIILVCLNRWLLSLPEGDYLPICLNIAF
jgi:hypothetical protein